MAANFQFVMRSGPNTGKTYPLEAPEIIIGRDASNGIAINDAEISRKHAKLSLHGFAYVIQDLGSTNGTFVNRQLISGTQVLNAGDTVSFGENVVLLYENAMDPNATIIPLTQAPKIVAPVRRPDPTLAPAPSPAYTPAPAPVYSGQMLAGLVPMAEIPVKKKFPKWLIFLIVFLVVIGAIVVFFLVIDQLNLWCKVVPFLVPLLGATCA